MGLIFKTRTPSPAQTLTVVQENSECGRAALCSPVSGPLCPCPGGSSPPRTEPYSGFVPSSLQSSGPASSSCCDLSTGPRRGAWPGMTLVVVWTTPPRLRPCLVLCPCPASSVWLEWADHWLETGAKVLKYHKTWAENQHLFWHKMTHCCGISSCANVFLCCGWSAPASDFGFALWSLWHGWLSWSWVPLYRLLSRPWLAPWVDWGRLGWPSQGHCLKDRLQTVGDTWWSYTLWWLTWRSDWRAGRSPGGSPTPRLCGGDHLAARCCGGIEWRAETGLLSSSSLSPREETHSRLQGWLSFSEPLWCRTRAPLKPAESRSHTAPSRSSVELTSASGCWWGCAEVWWRSMTWTWW